MDMCGDVFLRETDQRKTVEKNGRGGNWDIFDLQDIQDRVSEVQ